MRRFIKFLFLLLTVIGVFFIQSVILLVFPEPFSKINLIILVLVLLIVWYEAGWVIWYAFLLFFLMDLYSFSPFGITLFSGTISTLLIYYFYLNVFTNKSWYGIIALSFLGLICFRVVYLFLQILVKSTANTGFSLSLNLLQSIGWEILLTTLCVAIFYTILAKFTKKLSMNTV